MSTVAPILTTQRSNISSNGDQIVTASVASIKELETDSQPAISSKTTDRSSASIKRVPVVTDKYCSVFQNVKCIEMNPQVKRLQTIVRKKESPRTDFCFAADRLIRLVVEEGLDMLPVVEKNVETPGGHTYEGSEWTRSSCGVSIIRSGEAMEHGLRDCCRSMRIGKILIQTDEETGKVCTYYSKFPPGIRERIILLMYPILNYGSTVSEAVTVLMNHGIKCNQIVLLTLFASPTGIELLSKKYPNMKILTTEISSVVPTHFSTKYFGTH